MIADKLIENIELTTSAITDEAATTMEPEWTTEDPDSTLRSAEEFQLTQMHGHEFDKGAKKDNSSANSDSQEDEYETQVIAV